MLETLIRLTVHGKGFGPMPSGPGSNIYPQDNRIFLKDQKIHFFQLKENPQTTVNFPKFFQIKRFLEISQKQTQKTMASSP